MLGYFTRAKEITKIGVLVKDLRPSTLTYGLIDVGNKIANKSTDIDFYVFNEDVKMPPKSIGFPVFQYRNAWGFEGTLISTDINTTRVLQKFPETCRKIFYVWNIQEWTTLPNVEDAYEILSDENIELVTRSDEYVDILRNNFNRLSVARLEDFNYEQLYRIIKQ